MSILKFNSAVEAALIAFGFDCRQVNFSIQSRFDIPEGNTLYPYHISLTVFYYYHELDSNFTIIVRTDEEGLQTSLLVRVMAALEAIRTKWAMDHEGESDSPRDILDRV